MTRSRTQKTPAPRETSPREIHFTRVVFANGTEGHVIFQGANMSPIPIGIIGKKDRGQWSCSMNGKNSGCTTSFGRGYFRVMTDKRAYRRFLDKEVIFPTLNAAKKAVQDARDAEIDRRAKARAARMAK